MNDIPSIAIKNAGSWLVTWVFQQARMRQIVARPWAVIDDKVVGDEAVVYWAPDAVR
jgi:hypothetical protein